MEPAATAPTSPAERVSTVKSKLNVDAVSIQNIGFQSCCVPSQPDPSIPCLLPKGHVIKLMEPFVKSHMLVVGCIKYLDPGGGPEEKFWNYRSAK